ncbi:hypothetical protein B1A_08403, partial [mine drainage metagenome]
STRRTASGSSPRSFTEGNKEAVAKFTWRTLYIGNMHFQDAYDYDIQRLMRAISTTAVPDGRVIPVLLVQLRSDLPDRGREEVLDPDPGLAAREEHRRGPPEDHRDDGSQRRGHRRPRVLQDPGPQGRPGACRRPEPKRRRKRTNPFRPSALRGGR